MTSTDAAPSTAAAEGTASPAELLPGRLPRDRVRTADGTGEWSVSGRAPSVVVSPGDADEVAEVLRLATEHGFPVVPAGAGTWLRGGDVPERADVVVSTAQMDGIVAYEPDDLTLTAGAGVTLETIRRVTEEHGQWLPGGFQPPLAPRHVRAEPASATLGAILATAPSSPVAGTYGRIRDLVLGLTVVTGDGRILRTGGRVVKNVAGFDLTRLVVGSWGTLGVITEATVRLYPIPASVGRLIADARSLEALVPLARRAAASGGPVAAVTLSEAETGTDRRSARLEVLLHGSADAVDAAARSLTREVDGLERREDTSHPEVTTGRAGDDLVVALRALPAELEDLVHVGREFRRLEGTTGPATGARVLLEADAVEGLLRLRIPNLRTDGPWAGRWAERIEDLRTTLMLRRGSLSVEEAPREVVELCGAWRRAEGAEAALAGGIREHFDPAGVLVPGRRRE